MTRSSRIAPRCPRFVIYVASSALCGGFACQPAAPARVERAPAPVQPPPDAKPAAPAIASASSPPLSASELFSMLPEDERAKRDIVQRICSLAIGRYSGEFASELENQVVFGCSCCAPFEECPPTANSEPVVAEPAAVYPLRHWHEGSFTRAGAREVAATFEGCEPGAANRGGTIVLAEHGARLEPVVYRSGVNPDACKVLPKRNQQDRLVCLWSDGQGSTNYTRLLVVDLAPEDDNVVEVAFFDNDWACLRGAEPYVSIKVQDFELVDVNKDRQLDVVVQARSQSGVLREADLATCTDETWEPTTEPPPVAERFTYLAHGDGFVARSETAKRLEALYRDRGHRGEW